MDAVYVPAGGRRSESKTTMFGVAPLDIKVSTADTDGGFLVGEVTGVGFGVPRHFHYEQDEWFYVTKGAFLIEIGGEQFSAQAGDSAVGPRMVPHAWSHVGADPATMIFVLQPAGPFEDFIRVASDLGRLPTPEEANKIFEAHGMKITGPPLDVAKTSFEGA